MENSIHKKIERIAFPENIASVMSELMKNYGLSEKDEEILEKVMSGQPTDSERLAEIIQKAASGKIIAKNLFLELKDVFKIPEDDAKIFAEEIKNKVLPLAQKISDIEEESVEPLPEISLEIEQVSAKEEISLPQKKPYPSGRGDIYKEPIE